MDCLAFNVQFSTQNLTVTTFTFTRISMKRYNVRRSIFKSNSTQSIAFLHLIVPISLFKCSKSRTLYHPCNHFTVPFIPFPSLPLSPDYVPLPITRSRSRSVSGSISLTLSVVLCAPIWTLRKHDGFHVLFS